MEIEASFNVVVPDGAEGRLDRFLAAGFPEYSRSLFSRLIREGLVTADGRKVKPSSKVKPGHEISVTIPKPRVPEIIAQDIPIDVLHEDANIIVINKQAGLVIHPSYGHETGTLVNALLHYSKKLSGINGPGRPGIVHRLDRDTTGIIITAKNDRAHAYLAAQFHDRLVKKQYLAIGAGEMKADETTVDAPIGRSLSDGKKMAVRHDRGRDALTVVRVEERFRNFTYFRCFPRTGRTHQVRLHLKVLNHPIICDETYSRRRTLFASEIEGTKKQPDEQPLIERQALHAAAIEFEHPDGRRMNFEQPVPEDMARTLDALRRWR